MNAIPETTSYNELSFETYDPAEMRDVIRAGAIYYPVGLERRKKHPAETFLPTKDSLALTLDLMQQATTSETPIVLLVANAETNLAHYIREEAIKNGIEIDEKTVIGEATRRAELMGIRKVLFYESLQDHIQEHHDLPRIPVVLASEIIESDQEYFDEVREEIRSLVKNDPDYAEKVFNCIPKFAFPKEHRNKTLAEMSGKYLRVAKDLMEYVIYQLTTTIFLGGVKQGHMLEKPYNELTQETYARLPHLQRHGIGFMDHTIPGTSGVPYRGLPVSTQTSPDELITMGQAVRTVGCRTREEVEWIKHGLERGIPIPPQVLAAGHTTTPWTEEARMQIVDGLIQTAYKAMEEDLVLSATTHRGIFTRLQGSQKLDSETQQTLENYEILRCAAEVAESLSFIPEWHSVLKSYGILEVIYGRQPHETLHTDFPQFSTEPDEKYIARVIHSIAKHLPGLGYTNSFSLIMVHNLRQLLEDYEALATNYVA